MTGKLSLTIIFVLMLGVSGCGWWRDMGEWLRPPDMAKATPEGLYKRGAEQYQAGSYRKAIDSFQRMKEQFPLHPLVTDAELGIADSYFSNENYVEAELTYKDFIELRPTNNNVPYAMYQLAMCYYKQMDTIDRDQTDVVKALRAFEMLVARFPGSKFSLLAEQKVLECRKWLAEHEFYVGNFYFSRGKYKAALGRFETISRKYPGIGLDSKLAFYIDESKKRLNRQEAEEKAKKEKEAKKAGAKGEKAAATLNANTSTVDVKPTAATSGPNPAEAGAAETRPPQVKK
jgi:outer membrane protein assembly factor BamD